MAERKNKRKIVPREIIIEKIVEVVDELKKRIPVDHVYLFGSHAKGNPRPYSDVDIAVVSPEFGKNYIKETIFLMEMFHETGLMVEPHVYSKEEFVNAENDTFLFKEIVSKGVKII